MQFPTHFETFLKEIRLSEKEDFISAHKSLRELLEGDEELSPIVISTFLQGSYRRHTAIKPEGENKPDVDIVVVTTLDKDTLTPNQALGKFKSFLDNHYKDNWKIQQRSIAVTVGEIELDLVVTSAPSEVTKAFVENRLFRLSEDIEGIDRESWLKFAEELYEPNFTRLTDTTKAADPWRSDPLWIPDRELKEWTETDPLAQIAWTITKNKDTNTHYVNVVKALKWWKRSESDLPKYPKGYPLEHIIGQCCPDGITSVAEGVTRSLESIVEKYSAEYLGGSKPVLPDHGVPTHDVFARISIEDFQKFYEVVQGAAKATRAALDCEVKSESWQSWYDFFGDPFPKPDEDASKSIGERFGDIPAKIKEPERFG